MSNFQPTLLGTEIQFEEGDTPGMITDENETAVYVESAIYTGWIDKATFFELSGADFA